MKRITNYYDFVDFAKRRLNSTVAFRWCNACISVDFAGKIFFTSYKTEMLAYNRKMGVLQKLSDIETPTTLQHLRKFFDMISSRKDYYDFRKIRKGDFLIIYE